MFEELFNLLSHLGLGPAAQPVCDLVARLAGETMSLQHLQQEIRNVLTHHGRTHLTASVISALVELGLAGFAPFVDDANEDAAAAATAPARPPGKSPLRDSALLADASDAIVANPREMSAVHATARDWLDIDSGIYVDVGQHDPGSDSDSEK